MQITIYFYIWLEQEARSPIGSLNPVFWLASKCYRCLCLLWNSPANLVGHLRDALSLRWKREVFQINMKLFLLIVQIARQVLSLVLIGNVGNLISEMVYIIALTG